KTIATIQLTLLAAACTSLPSSSVKERLSEPRSASPRLCEVDERRLTSRDVLTDEILEAFEEPRLDNGFGEAVIRITVLRSFHAPIMFIFYPRREDPGEPLLYVKRLRRVVDEQFIDHRRVRHEDLDFHNQLKLRVGQRDALYTILGQADVGNLPSECWQRPGLDGSAWIYEFAAEGGSTLLRRRSPIATKDYLDSLARMDMLDQVDILRLAREMNLTTFAMMIWTLSGLDSEELY
ncbi:MAG: hypothetical protein KJ579_11435, partial [Verrucomicrobia bacterium]|nr:hypothetical protein [Verrucomicrobiota bacterium]